MNEVELFLKYDGASEPRHIRECFQEYYSFLTAARERFPKGALNFAEAPWHYDPTDPRCPHDAWLESFQLLEDFPQNDLSDANIVRLDLLGAFHDRKISVQYENVRYYSLVKVPTKDVPQEGHGDWLLDEVSLTQDGIVVHSIYWATGARWQIWCDDLHYSWMLFEESEEKGGGDENNSRTDQSW